MKLVAPLASLVFLAVTPTASTAEPELPKPVVKAYESLTDSIVNAKMPVFMKLFEIDYLYEEPDGTTLDRGPWRRLWLERFEAVSYERAAFHPVEVLSASEDQVTLNPYPNNPPLNQPSTFDGELLESGLYLTFGLSWVF